MYAIYSVFIDKKRLINERYHIFSSLYILDICIVLLHNKIMATISEILQVRISINDPDAINIIQVSDVSALPADPEPQTVYYTIDTARYYFTDETSGATASDYEYAELFVSDTRISTIIDNVGVENAVCRIFNIIAGTLGNKLKLIRTTSGSESAEYARILDLQKYYQNQAAVCKEQNNSDNNNNTGTMRQMKQPEIGGDNL